jgi:hypothetical protein
MKREELIAAMAAYVTSAGVPATEVDFDFHVKMMEAMMVSFHKYGRVAEAYPLRFSAVDDIRARLKKYRETGDKWFLADAANFAMIEAMHPAKADTAYLRNDVDTSPGRVSASGHRLLQEDNNGNRIAPGAHVLHHPSALGDVQPPSREALDRRERDLGIDGN